MGEQLSLDDAPRRRPIETLPDIGRWHAGGTDTERAAALAIAPKIGTQREKVLTAYKRAGEAGLTDEEASVMARIRFAHVCGTRREELIAAGFPIVDSGFRRLTTSMRPAIVWILKQGEDDVGGELQSGAGDEADSGAADRSGPGSAPVAS